MMVLNQATENMGHKCCTLPRMTPPFPPEPQVFSFAPAVFRDRKPCFAPAKLSKCMGLSLNSLTRSCSPKVLTRKPGIPQAPFLYPRPLGLRSYIVRT